MHRAYIPALDGWRTIAVGLVVLSHIGIFYAPNPRVMHFLAHLGGQGVALFFAISGYLITTLLLRELDNTGRISLYSFYVRRTFRILPPAFAYLAVLGILSVVGTIGLSKGELIASAFFYNNYWPDRSWFTAHFWSLSTEEHFYAFWPAVIVLAGVRRSVWVAAAVIAATLIWRPFGFAMNWGTEPIQRTDMRLDAFMFASLCALLIHSGNAAPFFRRWWVGFAAAALLVAVYALTLRFPEFRNVKELAQASLMPVIVISAVFAPASSLVFRLLELKPMRLVGQWSYSIYLWQELLLTTRIPGPLWLKIAGLALAVFVSYRFIEGPARNLARRWLDKKTPQSTLELAQHAASSR